MYNLVQESALSVESVAFQIEAHYKDVRSSMEEKISMLIDSINGLSLEDINALDITDVYYSRKISNILEINLKAAITQNKDIEIVRCYDNLISEYSNQYTLPVSIENKKKNALVSLLKRSSVEKNIVALQKPL